MPRRLDGLVWPILVAGVLPVCLVVAADVLLGPSSGATPVVQALAVLSPLLVALGFVPRVGRRAWWIAVGGVLVAALLAAILTIAAFSALDGS